MKKETLDENQVQIGLEIMDKLDVPKGHLISKCSLGVIVWTKIPTKKFDKFYSRI